MINDLQTSSPLWKYVDDTSTSEVIKKGGVSNAQGIVDQVTEWSQENRVQLNSDNCKELRISFTKKPEVFDPVVIGGKEWTAQSYLVS